MKNATPVKTLIPKKAPLDPDRCLFEKAINRHSKGTVNESSESNGRKLEERLRAVSEEVR